MKHLRLRTSLVLAPLLALLSAACEESPSGPDNSPLTEAEIREVPLADFAVLALAYDNVLREHPDVGEESYVFARLLIDEVTELSRAQGNLLAAAADDEKDWMGLTPAERDLIWSGTNWLKIPVMKLLKEECLRVAQEQFPPATLKDGTGDAFRHAYWNVRMAQEFDLAWASAFATAHESLTVPGSERTMDLNNNEVGRILFSADQDGSAATLATRIKSYPLACMRENTAFDSSRLVYIVDCPTVRVYDDGPDFDDVYEVSLGSTVLGTTPAGSGTTWETSNLVTGTHSLRSKCTVDGTDGGCGYRVVLENGLTFSNGSTSTPQQVVSEGATGTLSVIAPTLEQIRQRSMQNALSAAPAFSAPLRGGTRP